ncbi:hypothetical protein MKW98_007576 [Papaver atlanticum]|uniref:Phytocyanin domain-containing protein n=1 Tax=Papaver atlanticum TaxID=357466 RepID=A0AAD4SME8_9MAGN|nr:hypothetical protein MKW98_007576 [Papaver atlanticum]
MVEELEREKEEIVVENVKVALENVKWRKGNNGTFVPLSFCSIFILLMIMPTDARTWIVGGTNGWTTNINYTIWSQNITIYKDDSLLFVYDKNHNVFEVNEMDYKACNISNPIQNWSGGYGRDIVPLSESKNYFFICGNGYCYEGVKVAIKVLEAPQPPSTSGTGSSLSFVVYLLGAFLVLFLLNSVCC